MIFRARSFLFRHRNSSLRPCIASALAGLLLSVLVLSCVFLARSTEIAKQLDTPTAQLARERAVDGFVPVFDGCGHPLAQRSRVSTAFVCAASSRPAFVCAASSGPVRE